MVSRVAIVAFWLVVIGLACVYLELARVRIGNRIHRNLLRVDEARERLRSRELEYSRLAGSAAFEVNVEEFLESVIDQTRT